jgi:hypothetical protein
VNAPVKSAATLDELYKQRRAILAKVEDIKATRAKLAEADLEVEAAKTAMDDFAAKYAATLDGWAASNCSGPRPIADYEAHKVLERRFLEARHCASLYEPAKNSLGIREKEIASELHEVGQSIKNAISEKFAGEYTASGVRAEKLRSELAELDERLLAARAFWSNLSEEFRAANGKRNPAYDAAAAKSEAAMEQNDATAAKNFAMHDHGLLMEIDGRFWQLFREG